jgi:hypothetical protein
VGLVAQECKCESLFRLSCISDHQQRSSQPNVRTIEGVLFEALVKAGAVSKDNADDPVKASVAIHRTCAQTNIMPVNR